MKSKQSLASEHSWAKKLPTGWRYEFFGDLIKDTVDNRGRTVPTSDFGIPLIATNCISNSSLYPVFKDIRYVSQKTYDEWFRDGHAEPNDIIFVNKGTPGQICFIPDPIHFCFAQDMIGLKVNHEKINSKYLFAVLRTKFMQEQIDAFHVGTLIPHFKKSDFNSIIIPIPPKKLEDLIGEYYFSISQKIESLQNQNKILEQITQAIFKSWFVDFDGVTEFEDSEIGQIPKGWKIKKLVDICTTQYGYTESASDEEIGPKFLRVTDMNKQPWINWDYVPYCKITEDDFEKYSLKQGDVIVSRMADPGKAAIMEEDTKAVFASYLVRLKTSSIIQSYFIFYFLRSTKYLDYAYGASGSGSTRQNMNAKVITGVDLVIPPDETTKSFFKLIYPIRINIVNNIHQINHLTKIRDALLPKLMSEEIRV